MSRPSAMGLLVDGAELVVHLGADLPVGLDRLVRRSLAGHAPSPEACSSPAAAHLVLTGGGPTTLASQAPRSPVVVAEGEALPFTTPTTSDDDYLLFALGEWVDAASLRHGTPGAVRLHAAAFVDDDRTWVVVGPSGSGKTTLTLAAVAAGARYLTEERVTVHAPDGRVTGLHRPIRVRIPPNGPDPLAGSALAGDTFDDAFRRLVPADVLDRRGGLQHAPVAPTDLVVLDEEPGPERTAGWVLRQLVDHALNLADVGPAGLLDLAHLVARCRLQVVPARSLRSVRDLVDGRPPTDVIPVLLPPTADPGHGGPHPAPGVRTVVLGTESLVWVPGPPPSVVHLAGVGAAWWRRWADGEASPPDGDDDGSGVQPFAAELTALGALAPDARTATGSRIGS